MEHITGNMATAHRQDNGEFIPILGMRVRKELILCYTVAGPIEKPGDKDDGKFTLNFLMAQGWTASQPDSLEEVTKVFERLEWIYKKDAKNEA